MRENNNKADFFVIMYVLEYNYWSVESVPYQTKIENLIWLSFLVKVRVLNIFNRKSVLWTRPTPIKNG